MTLYENEYGIFIWYPGGRLLCHRWKPRSIDLEDETYKKHLLNYDKLVDEYKPKHILADQQQFQYPIYPDLQLWVAEHLFQNILAGVVDKMAILVSRDLIAELAVEQTVSEVQDVGFQIQYFNDEQQATAWLNEENL